MNATPFARRHAAPVFALLAVAAAGWALMPHAGKQSAVQWIDDVCSAVSRPMFASPPVPAGSGAAARPSVSVKVLSCESLPHVPGKSVTTAIVDFPPLAYSGAHRHPGSVTVLMLEGMVRSQLAGGPAGDYKTGETFFEPPGTLHLFAENPDPVRHAKLVSVFVTDENCGPLVLPP
ncbi:cupin domain-containing protein [Variovorax sp. GB1P17]|uniref:cupin domain-containing protein n=1 Tax=Variovorax sp. GB1P17 TaxID=3443740 RepID=UPI003F4596FC